MHDNCIFNLLPFIYLAFICHCRSVAVLDQTSSLAKPVPDVSGEGAENLKWAIIPDMVVLSEDAQTIYRNGVLVALKPM